MKTIAIDAQGLAHTRPTGVENATRELIQALLTIDTVNHYILYTPVPLSPDFNFGANVQVKILPPRMFWTWRAIGGALKKDQPDVYWAPSNYLPPNLPQTVLATVHDLVFIKHPELMGTKDRLLNKFTIDRAIRFATKLIAVSEATKNDLIEYANIDPERIEVIYHGLPSSRARYTDGEASLNLPNEFALVVGRIEPRKNPLNIIRGFAEMTTEHPNLHLVFAGFPGRGFEQVTKLIEELGLTRKVIFLDFVTPKNLTQLYHQAKILLYPSLFEGFGFNILEGFASRVPVITSNFGATAEIAGDAAYLVDPTKPYEIATAIDVLVSDFALRTKLISAGESRVKDFSWTRSANQLLELINNL